MTRSEVEEICNKSQFKGQRFQDDIIETHISWVLFTKDYALKIKRPVKLPFLDFSTMAKRLEYCEREVILNRRLTDIYLGISSLKPVEESWLFTPVNILESQSEGKLSMEGEPVVVMKRVAEDRRMDHLIQSGELKTSQINNLAKLVAEFHHSSPVRDANHLPKLWRNHWKEFFALFQKVRDKDIISTSILKDTSIRDIDLIINRLINEVQIRSSKGLVKDLHGDLHTANVFFDPHPVIFDCIEFSDQFRWIDQMDEVAMLYSDLVRLNDRDSAREFLQAYDEGNPGVLPNKDSELFNYYCAYRLSIRAKILIISILDSNLSGKSVEKHKIELIFFLQLVSDFIQKIR